jgi:hypothetical protein
MRALANPAIFLCLLLAGCASWIQSEPSKVDPVERRYIEAETNLKNAYRLLSQLADKEMEARAKGEPVGSVVTKEAYFTHLARLGSAKRLLRDGRAIGSGCLDSASYAELGLSGCLSREQIALSVLAIITKFNEGSQQ